MAILPTLNEADLIDAYRPRTAFVAPEVTQADNPHRDLQRVGGVSLPELPDPTIGGENGSRIRNGFSTGFANRFAKFNGAMAKPPAITNPIQGEVGQSGRADRLYAGVMNQLVQYTPASNNLTFVTKGGK